MQQKEFQTLVETLCQQPGLPEALNLLKSSSDEDVAAAAQSLAGQFALAEVDGERRIYHVTVQKNADGEEQEFVEHIMNEGDSVIKFVAWFFALEFDVKPKEIYQAAGKTYQQPKRS